MDEIAICTVNFHTVEARTIDRFRGCLSKDGDEILDFSDSKWTRWNPATERNVRCSRQIKSVSLENLGISGPAKS